MKKGIRFLATLFACLIAFANGNVAYAEENRLIDVTDVRVVESSLEGKVDENGAVQAGKSFEIMITATASEDVHVYDVSMSYRGKETRYSKYDWDDEWSLKAGEESICILEVELDKYQPTDLYQLENLSLSVDEYEEPFLYTRNENWKSDYSVVNDNGDAVAPTISAVKRMPVDGIETDSEVTYQITYNEQGAGVSSIETYFKLEGDEHEEFGDYYSAEFYEEGEAVGCATVDCISNMRSPGKYELGYISIMDHAGNRVDYEYNEEKDGYICYINDEKYDEEFTIDVDDTYQVTESSKPIEERAIILKELKMLNDNKKVKAPGNLKYELTITAPEEASLYEVELEYYSAADGKVIYTWGELTDEEWNSFMPGKAGGTITFETELFGYISTGKYELVSISFGRDDENSIDYTYTRKKNADGTYGNVFEGKSDLNCDAYDFTYNGAADFTVTSSLGADDVAPKVTGISVLADEEIGANTPITLRVNYEENESGICDMLVVYENEDHSEIFTYALEEGEDPDGVVEIVSNRRKSGTYKLSYLHITDKAGNTRYYSYAKKEGCLIDEEEGHRIDAGDSMFYVVIPTTTPVENEMIVLKDVCINDADKEQVNAPSTLTLEVSVTAPEKIAIERMDVCYYNSEADAEVVFSKSFAKKPWKPGITGDTCTLEIELSGYEDLGEYVLEGIDFLIAGTEEYTSYYRIYDDRDNPTNILQGEDEATLMEYEYVYDGAADFGIKKNQGKDTVPPKILSVKQKTKGPYYPDSQIEYTVGFEEKESGVAGVLISFVRDDEEFEDIYEFEVVDKIEGNQITVTSDERKTGNYRLMAMLILDRAGNMSLYAYDEEDECWYAVYNLEDTEQVTLDADETYKVVKSCSHKWSEHVVTPASVENEGIVAKKCTKCDTIQAGSEKEIPKLGEAKLSYEVTTYNGKVKKPSVTVTDVDGNKISSANYSVKYESGRKNPDAYDVTVTFKNKYEGESHLTFLIQPKAPSSVSATLTSANAIKVSWKKSTGADGYHLYYGIAGTEEYILVDEEFPNREYEFTDLEYGVEYEFKVFPYLDIDGNIVRSEKSVKTSIYTLKQVEDVKVERSSSSKVKVSWTNISGESGYRVVRYDANNNKKTYYVDGTKVKSKTISATAGKEYQYEVTAYKKVGSKKIYGPESDCVTFTLRNVKAVKNVKATLDGVYNNVKVTWSPASGATGYIVSVKKDKNEYKELAYVTETELAVEETLEDGAKYTFKVEPVYKDGEQIIAKGETDTAVVYVLKAPTSFKVAKSGSKVKVSWKDMSGESGYQVLQNTVDGLGSGIACTTTKTSITLSATKDITYTYQVRAYKLVDGEPIYGPSTEVKEYTRK